MKPSANPVVLGLAGVATVLVVSGVTGKGIGDIFKGDFGHLPKKGDNPNSPTGSGADSSGTPSGGYFGGDTSGWFFPLPRSVAAKPSRWTQDQGVDIAAPGGTPLFAMHSGTIVKKGIGGFGPNAPVLDIGGGRYIYYGHSGPSKPVGSKVGGGSPIAVVGVGIVGKSTGPHLEIGFCDKNGTPAKGTSGQMLSLLKQTYTAKSTNAGVSALSRFTKGVF